MPGERDTDSTPQHSTLEYPEIGMAIEVEEWIK